MERVSQSETLICDRAAEADNNLRHYLTQVGRY